MNHASSSGAAEASGDPVAESDQDTEGSEPDSGVSVDGDLYADGYTDADDEGYSSGKKQPPALTRLEKRLASGSKVKAAANLPLTSGEMHGDVPIPLEDKLSYFWTRFPECSWMACNTVFVGNTTLLLAATSLTVPVHMFSCLHCRSLLPGTFCSSLTEGTTF